MASILRAWNLVIGGARKITSITLGTKEALCTTQVDANGKVPGESGYTGPVVQSILIDEAGKPLTPVSSIKIKDAAGTNELVIDSLGRISSIKSHDTISIVDAATIEATVTSEAIDFSKYQHFDITYKLGAGAGGTPTLIITVVEIDSNGNEITDTDYTSSALAASSSGHIKGYFESYSSFKVRCALGGSGTLAASTIEIHLKS